METGFPYLKCRWTKRTADENYLRFSLKNYLQCYAYHWMHKRLQNTFENGLKLPDNLTVRDASQTLNCAVDCIGQIVINIFAYKFD